MPSTTPRTTGTHRSDTGRGLPLAPAVLGALLALGVAAVHVIDQGGLIGAKSPSYVAVGYWLLEAAGVVTAAALLARSTRAIGWLLSVGVAAGPIIGYVLSRGPGLPAYSDDKGNWTEPLGILSLVVEGVLLVMALTSTAVHRRAVTTDVPVEERELAGVR